MVLCAASRAGRGADRWTSDSLGAHPHVRARRAEPPAGHRPLLRQQRLHRAAGALQRHAQPRGRAQGAPCCVIGVVQLCSKRSAKTKHKHKTAAAVRRSTFSCACGTCPSRTSTPRTACWSAACQTCQTCTSASRGEPLPNYPSSLPQQLARRTVSEPACARARPILSRRYGYLEHIDHGKAFVNELISAIVHLLEVRAGLDATEVRPAGASSLLSPSRLAACRPPPTPTGATPFPHERPWRAGHVGCAPGRHHLAGLALFGHPGQAAAAAAARVAGQAVPPRAGGPGGRGPRTPHGPPARVGAAAADPVVLAAAHLEQAAVRQRLGGE